MDLRELVFAATEVGDMTQREIAETFQVSVAWIRKLQKLARESNSLASKPHGGGESGAFNGESAERLIQAVKDQLDATLKQLASLAGVSCSTSATDRMLRKLGITRKKNGMTMRKIQYWVIPPDQDAEFVACMEEVLETYALAFDPNYPVICMD